jgi:outer membrane immunogenic protein
MSTVCQVRLWRTRRESISEYFPGSNRAGGQFTEVLEMKRLFLASVAGLAALTMMQSANAADIARRQAMPTKAPAYFAPYNWSGFYVGINGGGGWGNSEWTNRALGSTRSFDISGGLVGGTIGYNWQINQFVFGLEGDID